MKAFNHHQVLVHVMLLVLLICQIPQEVLSYHSEYQNQHHEVDLRSSSHHGHHGSGVSRIRSKRGAVTHYSEEFSCSKNAECLGFERSYCHTIKGICKCPVDHPILDYNNGYCVAEVKLNSQCTFNSECDAAEEFRYCGVEGKCICKDGYKIEHYPDVGNVCIRNTIAYNQGRIQCTEDADCTVLEYSTCSRNIGLCTCPVDRPIADYSNDICVAEVKLNSQCTFDSECDAAEEFSYCGVEGKCICKDGYKIEQYPDVGNVCIRYIIAYKEGRIQCTEDADCRDLEHSTCSRTMGLCLCPVDRPIADYNNVCVAEVTLNSQCTFDSECDAVEEFSYCGVEGKCICKDGYKIEQYPYVGNVCIHDKNTGTSKTAVTSVIIISLILLTYLG